MIPCIASASVPITTSPYGTLTQELIARYSAKGVSRRPAELVAIDNFYTALINGGWISATPSSSDNLQDLSLFFVDPTGLPAGDAQKIASTKLLKFHFLPDFDLSFNNASNSNFSMSLGLSATPGAGGTNFSTKIPLNYGITSTNRNRTMFVYPTATTSASFATWLHGRDSFISPASEFAVRTHNVANTSLNFQFRNGSINATSQNYVDRTIFVTSRFNGDERIINANTDVGTSANTATTVNPGTDVIGGCCYWNDSIPGDSYDVRMGLCGFIRTGITATQAGALNTIIQNFVAALRATEEPSLVGGDGVPMAMFAAF